MTVADRRAGRKPDFGRRAEADFPDVVLAVIIGSLCAN
jgi:hypothetical protein